MKCKRCEKSRQKERYCSDCKKAIAQERNIRYRTRKSMSKALRKKLGM